MTNKNKIDFFLVGAARCGTTSLYNYLNNSDEIFLPLVKEPNFFSAVDSPNLEDYKLPDLDKKYHAKIINSLDVYNSLYNKAAVGQLKGDTSPSYLWDYNVAKKLYIHNPNAKIIISLRHPVDRAYSHYIMNYYTGVDTNKEFTDALKAPKSELWGSCNYYLEMGEYYSQVKAYYDVFPSNQIMVLVYEDWTKNITYEFKRLLSFLDIKFNDELLRKPVDSNRIKPMKQVTLLNFLRQNKIKATIKSIINQDLIDKIKSSFFTENKEIKKIEPVLRQSLFKHFSTDVKMLSELTNIDFNSKWY